MRCLKCGNKLDDNSKKCAICGALVGKNNSASKSPDNNMPEAVIASDFPEWDLTPPDSMVFRKK